AANGRSLSQQALGRIIYGRWGSEAGEDLVVCRLDEHALEIHCHGGTQSVQQITDDLCQHGCRQVSWREWLTMRAETPIAAAATAALAEASTIRTAAILLDQHQ